MTRGEAGERFGGPIAASDTSGRLVAAVAGTEISAAVLAMTARTSTFYGASPSYSWTSPSKFVLAGNLAAGNQTRSAGHAFLPPGGKIQRAVGSGVNCGFALSSCSTAFLMLPSRTPLC